MKRIGGLLCVSVLALVNHSPAQKAQEQTPVVSRRFSISAGMGVGYVSAPEVVDLINASSVQLERQPEFKAGAEFFVSAGIPVSTDWTLKLEYAYLIMSFNSSVATLGASEYSVELHLPSLLGQFTVIEGGNYNVRIGAGLGYHFGSMTEKFPSVDDRYAGKGFGTVFDLEANTAFGDNLYAYFGGNLRWDFIGRLTNDVGRTARLASMSSDPTLQFFSAGARLGFTFYI